MHAEELGKLVQHDDQPDAGLEAGKHRRGDEVREEAEPEDPRQNENAPTSAVRVAVAVRRRPGSPSGTESPSCVPVRIASVVVELTLSTREEPRSA